MKKINVLAIGLMLGLTGVVYAVGNSQSATDSCAIKKDGSSCCKPNASCCKDGNGSCCKAKGITRQ
jgi:hypothetical protein